MASGKTNNNGSSMAKEKKCLCGLDKTCCPCQWKAEAWVAIALRWFLGLRLLTAGWNKFAGPDGLSFKHYYQSFVAGQMNYFSENTFLPKIFLWPYLHSIAYVEILLGALLLLGIKTKHTLVVTLLFLVSIGFGTMLMPQPQSPQIVTNIGVYLILAAAALLLHKHNKLELCGGRCINDSCETEPQEKKGKGKSLTKRVKKKPENKNSRPE